MQEEKSQRFYVEGMHCASCVFFIEEALRGKMGVAKTQVDLATCTVLVSGDLPEDPLRFAQELTGLVAGNGYRFSLEKRETQKNSREFFIAIPAAAAFIFAFLLFQRLGFVNLIGSGNMNYFTAVLIGLVASVSTCLAVVGGLVLSLSASSAKGSGRSRAQVFFHGGRLAGFFVLGGVIGAAGKVFQLGIVGTGVLGLLVALVMLVLGIHLLDVFPGISRLIPHMPKMFARHTGSLGTSSHVLAPVLVGIGTFFLPCGFTQSMQIYTLTTGSFFTGALTMFFFALGTLPVLAALSFGAFEIAHKPWKGVFFKAAGVVVITLALFNIINALVTLGILSPFFSF